MNNKQFDISPETLKALQESGLPPITARTQRLPNGQVTTDPRSLYADAGSVSLTSAGQINAEQAIAGNTELTNGGVLKVFGLANIKTESAENEFGLVSIQSLCITNI